MTAPQKESTPFIAKVVIVASLVFIVGYCGMRSDRHAKTTASPTTESGTRQVTDEQRLERETTNAAISAATDVIEKFVPRGSTVRYSTRRLVTQERNFAFVMMDFDTPDLQTWCALLRFDPPRGAKFFWNSRTGVWNCSDGVDQDALTLRQLSIKWPGAEDRVKDFAAPNGVQAKPTASDPSPRATAGSPALR